MLAGGRAAALVCTGLVVACSATGFDWQGRPDPDLSSYQRAFAAAVGERFDGSMDFAQLPAAAARQRVLWLGDHHRDPVLHDRHRRLLAALQRAGIDVCLGLEAIGQQDAGLLARFADGRASLDQLAAAARARWPDSWLDNDEVDWLHYRDLLAQARAANWPLFALEPAPRLPLAERDAVIAAAVQQAAAAHPQRLVVVVVGQAHLLGDGDLVKRTAAPSLALGAQPPAALAAAAPPRPAPGTLLRSSGGLWFFAELLPPR